MKPKVPFWLKIWSEGQIYPFLLLSLFQRSTIDFEPQTGTNKVLAFPAPKVYLYPEIHTEAVLVIKMDSKNIEKCVL